MKFAFSTVACPKWNFQTIAARAKEYGYDGVEIRASLGEKNLSAANIFLSEPARVREIFNSQGVAIACLSSPIAMTGERRKDQALAEECRRFVDMACAVGCGLVKVFDTQVQPGQSRWSTALALARWLEPLADYAAERDVQIVVENALSFRAAKEMWFILESVNHPAVSCCWDSLSAALIGESPAVSVPVLNSRIQLVHVKDARIRPTGAEFCLLGEGDVPVEKLLIRLRGIGYRGWVSVEWDKAWLENLAEPEEILPQAIRKLREWTRPQITEQAKPKHQPAAH